MKIKFMFAWYDVWIGVFVDTKQRRIYLFPVPMFGVCIDYNVERLPRSQCHKCKHEAGDFWIYRYWWQKLIWGKPFPMYWCALLKHSVEDNGKCQWWKEK